MAIEAIALLHVTTLSLPSGSSLRVEALDDAVLVRTGANFATEPEQLSAQLHAALGDASFEQHGDPRGVFFLPDVAAPRARTYDAVIDEVGEGGVWGPSSRAAGVVLPTALGATDMAGLLGQVPSSLIDAVVEITRRDPNALLDASKQLQALIGDSGAQGVAQLLGHAGIDLSAGGVQQLVDSMQQELATHPDRLAGLAQQLLGGAAAREDGDGSDR